MMLLGASQSVDDQSAKTIFLYLRIEWFKLITDARQVGVDGFRINERGLEGYIVAKSFRSRVDWNSVNFTKGQV